MYRWLGRLLELGQHGTGRKLSVPKSPASATARTTRVSPAGPCKLLLQGYARLHLGQIVSACSYAGGVVWPKGCQDSPPRWKHVRHDRHELYKRLLAVQ